MTARTMPQGFDGDLLDRARSGDRDALQLVVDRAYPLVRRWCLARLGDPAEADDLTQDVLIRMIRRLDAYHGEARFTTWLYAVVRNAALDRLRRERRRARRQVELSDGGPTVPDPGPRPDQGLDTPLLARVIRAQFRSLPARQREVFDLSELQGLSAAEVAERLGIEPVSVRAHLFKARRALRERILEHHPEVVEEWT